MLHENGFTHGDLSRQNILLDDQGKIHIVDFGASLVVGGRRDINYDFENLPTESYRQLRQTLPLTEIYYQELSNFLESIEADDIYYKLYLKDN